jgi:DtxR family Mn-dependent transcriptional regulator
MAIGESGENYLEAIYILSREKSIVRSVDIAGFLGVSKPSVSRAMSILKSEGYLQMHPGGKLILTETGRRVAESMFERHELISEFLVSLGVSRKTAAEDACRMEHVISGESFEKLRDHAKRQMES